MEACIRPTPNVPEYLYRNNRLEKSSVFWNNGHSIHQCRLISTFPMFSVFSVNVCTCEAFLFCAEVFLDNRIVIAVTKYDCCPKSSVRSKTRRRVENVLSVHKLQQLVCDQVKNATGMQCPLDIIVPVSAVWAEQARELRQDPLEPSLRQDVIDSLSLCKVLDPLMQGQGETATSMSSLTLASQLERSSEIKQLEKR